MSDITEAREAWGRAASYAHSTHDAGSVYWYALVAMLCRAIIYAAFIVAGRRES